MWLHVFMCTWPIWMISECLHCNSHQQHQFLHFCPWRFTHPGGKCPASVCNQHCGRLCPLFGEGISQLHNTNTKAPNAVNPNLDVLRCSWSPAQRLLVSWLWTTRRTTRCGSCPSSLYYSSPSWWPTASCLSLKMWSTFSFFALLWTQSTMMAALGASSTWTKP